MNEKNVRIAAARNILKNRNCTHLLVSDPVDAEYISGFRASRVYLLISATKALLFTDFRYGQEARRFCRLGRPWRFCMIKGQRYDFLARHVRRGSRVAFQSDALTVDAMLKMKQSLKGSALVPIAAEVSFAGAVKTAAERAAITAAGRMALAAFDRFSRRLRAGMTEKQAAMLLDSICASLGSQKRPFETIVLFGASTALPHGRPGAGRLRPGQLVLADFGCTVRGLCSDLTRTVCFGPSSRRQRAIYGIVKQAQAAARAAARPGCAGGDVDAAGRAVIARAGYGRAFGHSLGHGLGRRVHEHPRVSSKSTDILEQGCVFTIEPGIYLPGWGGIRIEDMAVVGKKGTKLLTSSPDSLFEIKI